MTAPESPFRIEPTRLESPPNTITDLIAELYAAATTLDKSLHPKTAQALAQLVRIMNTYYSNLIEGHNTRPRDIERAIQGDLDLDLHRRNLQIEAKAHLILQTQIDEFYSQGKLNEPASISFISELHRQFYLHTPEEMLWVQESEHRFKMIPGEFRSLPEHDVVVGRHIPPSSQHVLAFMQYFESQFQKNKLMGITHQVTAIAIAHHRLNYIHPFADGNGRVSRLMSHAMAQTFGVGAHGLWSISRGLARGLSSRSEYKSMMDLADTPRTSDLDGRGNLSRAALIEYTEWFLRVCLDQVKFMTDLFGINTLSNRLTRYVALRADVFKPEAAYLLQEALLRGEFERGEISRITQLPERTARRVFTSVLEAGLLASTTAKGPVSLRFPSDTHEILFPKLFPET